MAIIMIIYPHGDIKTCEINTAHKRVTRVTVVGATARSGDTKGPLGLPGEPSDGPTRAYCRRASFRQNFLFWPPRAIFATGFELAPGPEILPETRPGSMPASARPMAAQGALSCRLTERWHHG